jgi:hypothetical protein
MRMLGVIALVAAIAVAGCGSGGQAGDDNSTSGPVANASAQASCLDWCGTGSATITVAGAAVNVTGGGCVVQGDSVDARFGDWWAGAASTNQVMILAYKTAKVTPQVSGNAKGARFILGTDATATVTATMTGTFAGTNSVGGTQAISGTFTCK